MYMYTRLVLLLAVYYNVHYMFVHGTVQLNRCKKIDVWAVSIPLTKLMRIEWHRQTERGSDKLSLVRRK